MKTPMTGEEIETMSSTSLGDELLHDFYTQMSELIDQLHTEVSEYTPVFVESFFMLRSNATKIFRNFIGDVEDLMNQIKILDQNMVIQGKLFNYDR